ncbi:MAG: hypothetical protein JXA73_14165 [Acidobacteria bacterium]|nr:hypothetical protein [Acidobacteriota bacterium]
MPGIFFSVLKNRSFLEFALRPRFKSWRSPELQLLNLLRLGVYQLLLLSKIPSYAAVHGKCRIDVEICWPTQSLSL